MSVAGSHEEERKVQWTELKSSALRLREEQSHQARLPAVPCNFAEIDVNFLDYILFISPPAPFQTQSRGAQMQEYEYSSNFIILSTYVFQVGIYSYFLIYSF